MRDRSATHHAVDDQLYSTLDSLDDAVNYMSWIVDLLRPYLDGPILELGAGHGTFTERLAEIAPVHAVEPSEIAGAVLADRFGDHERVTVSRALIHELEHASDYGSVVLVNVLEHIDDDDQALREILRRLRPGGHVAVWVPAFELLYSEFDRRLGHHRRYRRGQLVTKFESAGFRVVEARYVNLPGWFSWLIVARIFRQTPSSGPLVSMFDRVIVPVTRMFEDRLRVPFGQSVLVVGRRPFSLL